MRHQQDGLDIGLAALPGVQQAQIPHHLALQCGMQFRKTLCQQCVQLPELISVERGIVSGRGGAQAHRFAKTGSGTCFINRQHRNGSDIELARTLAQGVDGQYHHQQDQSAQQNPQYFLDHWASPN